MAAEYPDFNRRGSPRIPHPVNWSHVTEPARQAYCMGHELLWTQQHLHHSHSYPYNHHLGGPIPLPPLGMHNVLWREIEKQRIREEIIASEIERLRVLEAKVRRELMIKRESGGLRTGAHGVPQVMGFESPTRLSMMGHGAVSEGMSFEGRIIKSLGEEWLSGRCEDGGFKTLTFVRPSEDMGALNAGPVSDGGKEKSNIVLLAKPNEDKRESKRKAEMLPAGPDCNQSPSDGSISKKKAKEWSCSLCLVSTTGEQALNDHLRGKKHKSKEAAQRANKASKNCSNELYQKKNATEQIMSPSKSVTTENVSMEHSSNVAVVPQVPAKDDSKKIRLRVWCDLCHVGSNSVKVMKMHKMGKKHARQLKAKASKQMEIIMLVNQEGVLMEAGPRVFDPVVENEANDDLANRDMARVPQGDELTVS